MNLEGRSRLFYDQGFFADVSAEWQLVSLVILGSRFDSSNSEERTKIKGEASVGAPDRYL